jgi:methylated-DNA-[protein]-cysteine S-methyltransferase
MYYSLSLHAHVLVAEQGIRSVELTLSQQDTFTWTIDNRSHNSALEDHVASWLYAYSNQKIHAPLPPLDSGWLSPFTQKVLKLIATIPFGATHSYKYLAAQLGNPHAARAVGQACSRNPYLLFVPCHRVISSSQKIGNFTAGAEIKQILLGFELKNRWHTRD